jgi:hypothetical protein
VRMPALVGDAAELSVNALPAASASHPPGFDVHSVWDVLWLFGIHSPRAPRFVPEHLPAGLVRLQRLPRVSPALLDATLLATLSTMLSGPVAFDALCEHSPTPARELCRHLCALHLTRAIVAV